MNTEPIKPDLSGLRINRDAPAVRADRPGSSKRWLWIAPLVLVLAAVLYFSTSGKSSAVSVQTTTVKRLAPAAAQSLLTATGYVVAQRKAAVASKGTGRLEILNVEEGDEVRAGDVIGRLESNDVAASLSSAQAGVEQAEAVVRQTEALQHEAQVDFDRIQNLLSRDLTSRAEFDRAEARRRTTVADVEAAQAGLERAQADLRYAEVQVENTFIRAPFDGTVLTKDADVGEVVAPFAASASSRGALVTLADMTSLEVEADVSESNIRKISIGQPCLVTLDALPAEPYTGKVKKIVPTADRSKATVLTKISFDELDDRVLPEMSAKVNFLPSEGSDTRVIQSGTVLTVPTTAFTEHNGMTVVYRVRNEIAVAVPVEPRESYGGATAVSGELQEGDIIVVAPPANLSDGDRITTGE